MDLLQAARLSRLGEASTGIEKQDEQAQRYVYISGDKIVATAADTDVSGSVSPWERPKLGPWLTERSAEFDGIIASALDRLGRNARHLIRLRDWAEDNGKKLIVISPSLQWPPAQDDLASPIIWDVLGRLAEYELAAITKRNRETQAWLRTNGFLVGRPPFGYIVAPKGDHKTIVPVKELSPYVIGMFERYLAGSSLTQICQWLDSESTAPPMGGAWSQKSVSQILRNPVYSGRRTDAGGKTILRVEPVVSVSLQKRVIQKLDNAPRRGGGPSGDTALLTNVVHCFKCRRPMYRKKTRNGLFYYCQGPARREESCKNLLPLEQMDAYAEFLITDLFSGQEETERTVIPGSGHEDEIEQVEQDIRELDLDDPGFLVKQAELMAERQHLRALPSEPDQVIERSTGRVFGQIWDSLGQQGKREWLVSRGMKIYVSKDGIDLEGFGDYSEDGLSWQARDMVPRRRGGQGGQVSMTRLVTQVSAKQN